MRYALQPQGLSPQNISAKADYSCVKPNTPGHLLSNSPHEFDTPRIHAVYRASILNIEATILSAFFA
jgi:hypothetical protein